MDLLNSGINCPQQKLLRTNARLNNPKINLLIFCLGNLPPLFIGEHSQLSPPFHQRLILVIAAATSSCIMPITMIVETFYLVMILLLTLPFASILSLMSSATTLLTLAFHRGQECSLPFFFTILEFIFMDLERTNGFIQTHCV